MNRQISHYKQFFFEGIPLPESGVIVVFSHDSDLTTTNVSPCVCPFVRWQIVKSSLNSIMGGPQGH